MADSSGISMADEQIGAPSLRAYASPTPPKPAPTNQWQLSERVLHSMTDAVIATDTDYLIQLINPAAEELYGISSATSVGKVSYDLISTEFGAPGANRDAVRQLWQDGQWSGRVRQLCADGEWRDIDATVSILSNDGGEPSGVVFVCRDITRARRAEREAAERNDFASAVLESLPGRTCVLDRSGIVSAHNHRYWDEGPAGAGEGTGPGVGGDYIAWVSEMVDDDAAQAVRELLEGDRLDFRTDFAAVRRRRRYWTELDAVPLGADAGGAVVTHVDITARKQAESNLTRRATHDPLTGLPNRVLLADRLSHALARTARTGGFVGVLFCDLDGFRDVNNTYGHLAGDRLLVTIAKRLRAVCRSSDTVARVSGDEFVIILEDVTGETEVEEVARRVIDALTEPVVLEEGTARTGTSIGLVISPGVARAGVRTVEGIIRDADSAMYAAKEAGRARFTWFTPEMRERPRERPTFAKAIGRLLNR